MMPGTKEVLKKSLWLNAWSRGPEAKTTAGAWPVHFPIPREGQSHLAGPVQAPPGQGRAEERTRPAGSGGHKPTRRSHFFFMVSGLYHLPINAGWVLIDSLWYPSPEGRKALFTGAEHRGQAFFFLLYLMLLLITEIRLKQLQQLIKEQCSFWHLPTDCTIGNS